MLVQQVQRDVLLVWLDLLVWLVSIVPPPQATPEQNTTITLKAVYTLGHGSSLIDVARWLFMHNVDDMCTLQFDSRSVCAGTYFDTVLHLIGDMGGNHVLTQQQQQQQPQLRGLRSIMEQQQQGQYVMQMEQQGCGMLPY